MLLDGNNHHMMDWMFWIDFNWLALIGSMVIFFILIFILLYVLKRGKHQVHERVQANPINNQNLGLYNKLENIKDVILNFCPNCGRQLGKTDIKYCPECGIEFEKIE